MKKIVFLMLLTCGMCSALFISCKKTSDSKIEPVATETAIVKNADNNQPFAARSWESFAACMFKAEICFGSGMCYYLYLRCFYELPVIPFPDFPCLKCPEEPFTNVWDLAKRVNPAKFYSIAAKLNTQFSSERDFAPFPVGDKIVGFQFYKPIKGTLDTKELIVSKTITLDQSMVTRLGLKANKILIGRYPVVYNQVNNTYNVLINVK